MMNYHFDRGMIPSLAFIVLAVGSMIYLGVATANYLVYYPALATIRFTAARPYMYRDASSNHTFLVTVFTITNPSTYSGFTLRSASTSTYLYNTLNTSNTILYYNTIAGYSGFSTPLPSGSTLTVSVNARVSPEQLSAVNQFVASHNGHVNATSYLRVDISSFLNPAIGHYPYTMLENYTYP